MTTTTTASASGSEAPQKGPSVGDDAGGSGDGDDDYVSVRMLRDYLASVPPGTRVNLDVECVEADQVAFASADENDYRPVSLEGGVWNALDFLESTRMSTAAELVAFLDPLVEGHAHAALLHKGGLLSIPVPNILRLPKNGARYLADTSFNPYRAGALLSSLAPCEPGRAHAVLAERCGAHVADEAKLYAVGARWLSKDQLLRRYPRLPSQPDWKRLFTPHAHTKLRVCAVDDATMLVEFGPCPTTVERLLKRARTDADGPPSPRPLSAAAAPAAKAAATPTSVHADRNTGDMP